MIYHKWEYGREHDWLAVDKNGHVGYFMSGHLNVLPDSVLIPWEYLHNLLYMWIAYCENVACSDVKLSKIAFERQVEILKNTGLSVWDADVCDGEFVFRKIAEPKSPIQLKELHPFFKRLLIALLFRRCHFLRHIFFVMFVSLVTRRLQMSNFIWNCPASACRYAIKKYYINCSLLRHWIYV